MEERADWGPLQMTVMAQCVCGEMVVRRDYLFGTVWAHGAGEAVLALSAAAWARCPIYPNGIPQPLADWLTRVHEYEGRPDFDRQAFFGGHPSPLP